MCVHVREKEQFLRFDIDSHNTARVDYFANEAGNQNGHDSVYVDQLSACIDLGAAPGTQYWAISFFYEECVKATGTRPYPEYSSQSDSIFASKRIDISRRNIGLPEPQECYTCKPDGTDPGVTDSGTCSNCGGKLHGADGTCLTSATTCTTGSFRNNDKSGCYYCPKTRYYITKDQQSCVACPDNAATCSGPNAIIDWYIQAPVGVIKTFINQISFFPISDATYYPSTDRSACLTCPQHATCTTNSSSIIPYVENRFQNITTFKQFK